MNTTTQDTIRTQSHKDPAQLEREIEQQRRHIEDIVQALENKLSPGEIFERVLNFGKGTGREFAGNLTDTVKANPVPALLTAAGIAWLYSSSRQRSATGTDMIVVESEVTTTDVEFDGSRAGGRSRGLGERAQSAKSAIGEKAHGAADAVRDRAHHAKDSVSHGFHRAKDGYGRMLEDNPLAAGAIAIAAGALLGALIAPTRREDELLGETRDRVADRLKDKAREQRETLAEHARHATEPDSAHAQAGDVSAAARSEAPSSAGYGASSSATPYGSRAH